MMFEFDPDWAPTQHMGHDGVKQVSEHEATAKKARHSRFLKRKVLDLQREATSKDDKKYTNQEKSDPLATDGTR